MSIERGSSQTIVKTALPYLLKNYPIPYIIGKVLKNVTIGENFVGSAGNGDFLFKKRQFPTVNFSTR
jgi:hydrogenase maturation factor HypE